MSRDEHNFPDPPGAIVMTLGGSYWVNEKPPEVRSKIEDAKTGMGPDDGLVTLAGLESTGKPGNAGLAAFTLAINPMYVIGVRGISRASWENSLRPQPQGTSMKDVFEGIFGTVIVAGTEGKEDEMPGGRSEPKLTEGADLSAQCCCGHIAGSHDRSTQFIGACQIDKCGCTLFHQHGKQPNG